jgi:uncharacterized protein YndB with AHSA1/START domain
MTSANITKPISEDAHDADFESTKHFASSPDAVFDALASAAGVSGWWVPASGSGSTGGELRFDFGEGSLVARVDEATRPTRVQWSPLVCDVEPNWVGTKIIFEISQADGGGSTLHFRHAGLTPRLECYDMCHLGWTTYLASLVDYVDHGQGHPSVPSR